MWEITLVMIIFLILVLGIVLILRIPEDSWIKDEKGIYVRHGFPLAMTEKVQEQKEAINCALNLYQEKSKIENFSSQCLGTCFDYAVDIVHVPRNQEDDLIENQCQDYLQGKVTKFIELDKSGKIVKIN